MSPVLEQIIEQIHALPFFERRKLLEILDSEKVEVEKERQRRIELSKEIMGKYEHLLTSSEEFARRKQEEIEREDKGWMPKE